MDSAGQPAADAMAAMQQQIAMEAMLEGINYSFYVTIFIVGVALFLAFFIKRAKQMEDPMEEQASIKGA